MNINWLKQNWKILALAVLAILYSFGTSDILWVVLFIYGMIIRYFLTATIPEKLLNFFKVTIWVVFFLWMASMFYVNYYLPHGDSYPTGDVVCQNDDRGPCGEQYKEDLSGLGIPNWAKFIRGSAGELMWIGLLFAGIVISSKNNNEES